MRVVTTSDFTYNGDELMDVMELKKNYGELVFSDDFIRRRAQPGSYLK